MKTLILATQPWLWVMSGIIAIEVTRVVVPVVLREVVPVVVNTVLEITTR